MLYAGVAKSGCCELVNGDISCVNRTRKEADRSEAVFGSPCGGRMAVVGVEPWVVSPR